jgi:hypothetical protein
MAKLANSQGDFVEAGRVGGAAEHRECLEVFMPFHVCKTLPHTISCFSNKPPKGSLQSYRMSQRGLLTLFQFLLVLICSRLVDNDARELQK